MKRFLTVWMLIGAMIATVPATPAQADQLFLVKILMPTELEGDPYEPEGTLATRVAELGHDQRGTATVPGVGRVGDMPASAFVIRILGTLRLLV